MSESFDQDRRRFLGSAAMAIGAGRLGVVGSAVEQIACAALRLPDEGALPSFDGATAWLHSPPLTATDLRGKIVLVQFWTYTCINWLRTLPYVRAWDRKYRERGLLLIGVHSPEFGFEQDVANVRRAATALEVDFPVAVDSDHAVWRAFANEYWPALYLADAQGRVRHHHFGEGQYEASERAIQRLLGEAGGADVDGGLVSVDAGGVEAAADWDNLWSPETYLGYERTERLASPGGVTPDARRLYALPARLARDQWALAGDWTIGPQPITLHAPGGRILYRCHARDVHLVMGPAVTGASVRFRVTIDGRPPGVDHGIDVDDQGNGTATEQRLYQLVRQRGPIADRLVEIAFLDAAVQAFAVTFG